MRGQSFLCRLRMSRGQVRTNPCPRVDVELACAGLDTVTPQLVGQLVGAVQGDEVPAPLNDAVQVLQAVRGARAWSAVVDRQKGRAQC